VKEKRKGTHTPETRCGGVDGAGSVAVGRAFPTLGTTSGSGGGGYVGLDEPYITVKILGYFQN
jgi:hypothetical protein